MKHHPLTFNVVAATTLLLLAGCGGDGDGDADSADPTATVTVTETLRVDDSDPLEEETTEPPEIVEPEGMRAADWKIKLKIREKECFGSAGCNVTFQIDPVYMGTTDISDGSWDITYKVSGGESGPTINTFTLEDGQASFDQEESLSTRSSGSKLTAKVTAIYEN